MSAPLDPAIQAAAERGQRTSALIEREMAHLRGSLRIIWDVGGYPAAMRAISLALSIVSEEAKSFAAELRTGKTGGAGQ